MPSPQLSPELFPVKSPEEIAAIQQSLKARA